MVLAPPRPAVTIRTAAALARAAYDDLHERARQTGDERTTRLADLVFARGSRLLSDIEPGPDLVLSDDATDALNAYLTSVRAEDDDAIMMWLSMLPDAVREIVRGARRREAPSIQVREDTSTTFTAWTGRDIWRSETHAEYQPAPRRRRLKLAA